MMPMIPDSLVMDPGSWNFAFAWTVDGSLPLVVAVLLGPWIAAGLAAAGATIAVALRHAETGMRAPASLRHAV